MAVKRAGRAPAASAAAAALESDGQLDRVDGVLEGAVVQLHDVDARRRPSAAEPAGQVHVDDVEAARSRARGRAPPY